MSVKRENYPEQLLTEDSSLILPGHTLSIRPPVIVRNLLPVELRYYIKDTAISGTVKAKDKAYLHAVSIPCLFMPIFLVLKSFMLSYFFYEDVKGLIVFEASDQDLHVAVVTSFSKLV